MKTKKILFLLCVVAVFFCTTSLYAAHVIANRSGAIRIEYPDGTTQDVGIDEGISNLPSGSIVYSMDSSMTVAPVEGYLTVVVGPSIAKVNAGSGVTVYYNKGKNASYFQCEAGEVTVHTGGLTTIVKKNEEVEITINEETGLPEARNFFE